MSYTSFAYSDIRLNHCEIYADDKVTVSFKIKNTGTRAGSDVAQVYVHDVVSSMNRPVKELCGFQKVHLQPGEEQEICITLDRRAFEFYTPKLHKWVVEDGDFEIMIGRSAGEIVLRTMLHINSNELVKRFSPQTWAGEFVKDARFQHIIKGEDEKIRTFFDAECNPLLAVAMAIPFGQFGDADLGQGKLSRDLIQKLINELNLSGAEDSFWSEWEV